jgi:cyclase
MLSKRIIPTLLCRGRNLYKGKQFKSWRSVGLVMQAVKVHQARGVDELILMDISATREKRGPDLSLVRELGDCCFTPLTVGGGVTKLQDVESLLRAGADKVAICSGIWGFGNTLLDQCVARFGGQAIVAVVEYHEMGFIGRPTTSIDCGRSQSYASPLDTAKDYAQRGAGEILLSSVARDGMMEGYDLKTIREVSQLVSVPLIASGGCGSYEHALAAIKAGADAVATGAMLQFTDATPAGMAEFLHDKGVEVRR